MKKIPLTQGKFALVDDEDFEELSKHNWRTLNAGATWYAVRHPKMVNGRRGTVILMHRQIMKTPHGMETDHGNHKGWDNRKHNLRVCTKSQNSMNRQANVRGESKYKGVSRHNNGKAWVAEIWVNRKKYYLGYFKSQKLAAQIYNKAAKYLHGDFATFNTVTH